MPGGLPGGGGWAVLELTGTVIVGTAFCSLSLSPQIVQCPAKAKIESMEEYSEAKT